MSLNMNFRSLFLIGGFFCLLLLGGAYLLEYKWQLNPCILCLLQRYALWAMAGFFLIAAFSKALFLRFFYAFTIIGLGLSGGILAGRQIWLQHLPKEMLPSCTAGLQRLLEVYPVFEALKMSFYSAGECGKDPFFILGISLATWSLLAFAVLVGFVIAILVRIKKGQIS